MSSNRQRSFKTGFPSTETQKKDAFKNLNQNRKADNQNNVETVFIYANPEFTDFEVTVEPI